MCGYNKFNNGKKIFSVRDRGRETERTGASVGNQDRDFMHMYTALEMKLNFCLRNSVRSFI